MYLLIVKNRQLKTSQESLNSDTASKPLNPDEEEADTDLETDRLLGQQRLDDHADGKVLIRSIINGFYFIMIYIFRTGVVKRIYPFGRQPQQLYLEHH